MLASGITIRQVVSVSFITSMATLMMEIGETTKQMVLEFT
jgi:hypothetical protein